MLKFCLLLSLFAGVAIASPSIAAFPDADASSQEEMQNSSEEGMLAENQAEEPLEIKYINHIMYRVRPKSQAQLDFLKSLTKLGFGVTFWHGIGEIGQTSDLIAPDADTHIPSLLSSNNIEVETTYENVTTIMQKYKQQYVHSAIQNQNNFEHANQIHRTPFSPQQLKSPSGTRLMAPNNREFIPIQPIPGTNLHTGIFYTINLKTQGIATWVGDKSGDFLHLAIVYGSELNDNYKPGGSYYESVQWLVMPSEVAGAYVLVNRELKRAVITWMGDSPSGQGYVGAGNFMDDSPDYLPGGKYRKDNLWTFNLASDDRDYHTFSNKGRDNNFVTWTSKEIGTITRKFMELVRASNDYRPGGKWRNDALWKFEPAANLEGEIIEFSTKNTPEEIINSKKSQVDFIQSQTIMNQGSVKLTKDMTRQEKVTDTFSFGFRQSLSICSKVSVEASPVPFFSKISMEVTTKLELEAKQEWTKTEEKNLNIWSKIRN